MLFGTPPTYTNLRVFGSLCVAYNKKVERDKIASRSRNSVFVGYPFRKKGWYLYDLDSNVYFVSRDVRFYESVFPFLETACVDISQEPTHEDVRGGTPNYYHWTCLDDEQEQGVLDFCAPETNINTETNIETNINTHEHVVGDVNTPSVSIDENGVDSNDGATHDEDLGRGNHARFSLIWMNDYVVKSRVLGSSPSDVSKIIVSSSLLDATSVDVDIAFLHGDLDEEVYMRLPRGFTPTTPGHICILCKSLYGLKQAPRCWFAILVCALTEYGFVQSHSDYSLFTYFNGENQLNILIKDLGALKYFLGFEVAQNTEGIVFCQRKYALDVISEVGHLGIKPFVTPIEQNHTLGKNSNALMDDPEKYRQSQWASTLLG
ncbi:uncharacterized protein LOC141630074 [Silene latifolia]|uniref:uncharacterized protein LOC141630074 n=1 Tax=Silene latifolia TaxID=37657 RepID=UPI003D783AF2